MVTEEHKKKYKEKYTQAKQKGVKFWPDIIYKDLIVSFGLFLLLIGLATFIGVAGEPKADPSDTSYLPRPEWYFLFLFKFLALYGQIPWLGKIEWIAAILIPGIGIGVLFFLPFIDRNPFRHFSKRTFALTTMSIIVAWIVLLTIVASIPVAPNSAETQFSNALQAFVGLWIPAAGIIALAVVAALTKQINNGSLQQKIMVGVTTASIIGMIVFTGIVLGRASSYPKPEEETFAGTVTEQIVLGQDLYSIHCTECHGPDGEGGIIEGVEGLEGVELKPISSQDEMWTRSDETLFNIIDYGQQDLGMPPFGLGNGGELSRAEMDYIVTFMRYTWDSRAEIPEDAAGAGAIPPLAEGEVPSYEVHIQALVKRYCVSCHRPNKENNDYLMGTYEEILTTGENAGKNVVAGDLDSYIIVTLHRESIYDDAGQEIIGPMPPSKELKPEYIDMLERWILAGMPETADEAAALSTEAAPPEGESAPVETESPAEPGAATP